MSGLPTQVPWRRFVCVLRKLDYAAQKGKAGAARPFSPYADPKCCFIPGTPFRKERAPKNVEYLRKLLLDRMSSCSCWMTSRSGARTTASPSGSGMWKYRSPHG